MSTDTSTAIRQQYLQRLGIVHYVPKQSALGPVAEVPHAEVSIASKSPVEESAGVEAILNSMDTSDVKKQSTDQEIIIEQPSIALTFALWQATDELLICTAVDDQLPDQQQVTLLSNIVAAIENQVCRLPQCEIINWPPHANMQGDKEEIREYLSTLINARVDALSTEALLVLGEAAQQWLLNTEQRAESDEGIVALTDSLTALMVPSLPEMLNDPDCKRATWRVICGHFKRSS